MPEDVHRTITIRPSRYEDVDAIYDLWRSFGEGKVDIRSSEVVQAAVASGGLHVFATGTGEIIGTGAAYGYPNARIFELASSCWNPKYRGLGGAQISVAFRSITVLMTDQPHIVASELYYTSKASAKVLSRLNFEEVRFPPYDMQLHAYTANPTDPVRHFVLPPWYYAPLAQLVLKALCGQPLKPNGAVFEFDQSYVWQQPSGYEALVRLADGDLTIVGSEPISRMPIEQWLAGFEFGHPISFETLQERFQKI